MNDYDPTHDMDGNLRSHLVNASEQASGMNKAVEKLGAKPVVELPADALYVGLQTSARLIATGVARRDLERERLALEIAIETLKFIARATLTIDGVEHVEHMSRMEARVGLAKIERALGVAPTDQAATPPPSSPPQTAPAE